MEPTSSAGSPSAFNRMAISTIAPSGCDTLQPPTRLYSRRSLSPNGSTASDSDGQQGARTIIIADSANDPSLSSDVSGLHLAGRSQANSIVSVASATGQSRTAGPSTVGGASRPSSSKGKGKAKGEGLDWLQPPGRQLCARHQRMADEGTNQKLQRAIDTLPHADRVAVSNIWSSFSSSSHPRRALILQGILTMCCQSELSLLSEQLGLINRIDPFSLFPRELCLKILGYLDAKTLTRAAQVSRHWRTLADDDILWRNMCEQHVGRKCQKCGWGLPVLERRPASGENSPVGAGASASDHPDGGESHHHKRTAMEISDGEYSDDEHIRSPKRRRHDPSPPPEHEPTPPPAEPSPSPSPEPSPPPPVAPPPPPPPPQARAERSASYEPTSQPLSFTQLPLHILNRFTRPWKDVYSERLTIARNWKLGRSTVTTLRGHTDGVMCVQFNDKLQHPNFPILMTGSYDRTVRIWNMETGKEVLRLLGHTRAVRALQFDECKLVTGSMDRTLRLWNWRTGQCIRTLEGHTAGVVCLAFDSNILVSGSVDRTVKVWNFRTGDCFTLRGHMDWVNSVRIWDSMEATCVEEGGTSGPTPALDPGKMLFSASDDGTIKLWDLSARTCIRQFEGHVGQVQSIQLAFVDVEEEVEDTAKEEIVLDSSAPPAEGDDATPTVASDSSTPDAMQGVISSAPPASPPLVPTPLDAQSSKDVTRRTTPILISGSLDNTIRTWDVESGKRLKTLFGHIEGVWAVASDKLRLVSGSHDKTIKIWNRSEGKCTATLVGHRGAVTCLALGDDKIVSGSDDGDIRIWSFGGTAMPTPAAGGPGHIFRARQHPQYAAAGPSNSNASASSS